MDARADRHPAPAVAMHERRAGQPRWVMDFADGSRELRELLGGKGANVAEMTRVLGAERVPGGLHDHDRGVRRLHARRGAFPTGCSEEVQAALDRLEDLAGRRLGDAADPLLVSVRSGARESMPGMLDTVLNLGLNDETVRGLAARSGDERFAWDSYRRFVQMYGNVVAGHPRRALRARDRGRQGRARRVARHRARRGRAARADRASSRPSTSSPTIRQQQLARRDPGGVRLLAGRRARSPTGASTASPTSGARRSTSSRWCSATSASSSGSGVAFSRDELTGAPEPSGDFLANAQGEDVVSGVRTPRDLAELREWMPDVHAQLLEILRTLERHYGDMQDTEFTVQEGRLYMLQTRNAKRPAQAAVRFAVDAVAEGLLDREPALLTIDPATLDALLHPTFDPTADYEVLARGVAASPGAAKGEIVLSAPAADRARPPRAAT